MKESNIEGLASHDGPESCVGFREEVGEALTGERAGRDIEPRNPIERGCRRRPPKRKATRPGAIARAPGRPRAVEDPGMCGLSMRENREVHWLPALDGEAGRKGKAKATTR